MKTIPAFILLMPLSMVPVFAAVTIVECEDNQGERTFQASCLPGTTQVNAREIRTGSSPAAASRIGSDISATLYVVPECDPCEDVREFLQARNVALTVKDASFEQEVQEELKALTGTLRAPVVVIGEHIVTGYNRTELTSALTAAGYITPE